MEGNFQRGMYCPEGNYLKVIVRVQLSLGVLFRGNCPRDKSPGVNCPGGNFMGVNCPEGSGPEGNYSGVTVWEEKV